jgi:hypothetical protein
MKTLLYVALTPAICFFLPRILNVILKSEGIPRGDGSVFMLVVQILTILAFVVQVCFTVMIFRGSISGSVIMKIVYVVISFLALLVVSLYNFPYLFVLSV